MLRDNPTEHTIISVTGLSLLWLTIVLLMQPLTDFPLNDAWSYALSVRTLVEEGELMMGGWMSGPIITSLFWGSLFCLPFGFSIAALKISTMVLGLAGVIFTYLLVKELSGRNITSLAAAVIIALNPLFLNLSVTFMTDVQFYAFFVAALYFYILFIKRRKIHYVLVAMALALLSTFIRQFGIILPLSFAIYEAFSRRKLIHPLVISHFASFLVFVLLYIFYVQQLAASGQETAYRNITAIFQVSLPDLVWRIFTRTGLVLLEGGMWLFPVVIFWAIKKKKDIQAYWKPLLVLLAVLLVPVIRMYGEWPSGNILYDLGLGPVTTRDIYLNDAAGQLSGNALLWSIVRPIAFAGSIGIVLLGGLKVIRLKDMIKERRRGSTDNVWVSGLTGLIVMILYVGVIMISLTYFDRYILPLLILMFLFLRPAHMEKIKLSMAMRLAFVAIMMVFMTFGIVSTRFYLEWNRVRWAAAGELMDKGISARSIDGGHEFNGWHGAVILGDGGWRTEDYTYVLSFSELSNYHCLKETKMFHPILGKDIVFHVLKKDAR